MDCLVKTRLDIEKPRYDQSTYAGRLRHFSHVTNPLNMFASKDELDHCQRLVRQYRRGEEPRDTRDDDVWRAKQLYDSAFHPDTGHQNLLVGRMCAQVPLNMAITGCLITFYRTTPAVIFWQWFNQSFNAVVNYTNRGGDSSLTTGEIMTSYGLATASATGTALLLNKTVKSLPAICSRFIPFFAVVVANCINIPFMRNKELTEGTNVCDENGNLLGKSAICGQAGISQVLVSRILMTMPGMVIPPIIISLIENKTVFKKYPKRLIPIQIGLVGVCLVFATPLCCALFPQISSMKVDGLEEELRDSIRRKDDSITHVYFNKGL